MLPRRLLLVLALATLTFEACGGGGGEKATSTPQPSSTTIATTPAGTPRATLTPGPPLTLAISSVLPNPANVGDEVTITFKTQPMALIGFQITDAAGNIASQNVVTAGADGTATFAYTVAEPKGTWNVEAAAGATAADLLRLQASPTPGPETADTTFEVQ